MTNIYTREQVSELAERMRQEQETHALNDMTVRSAQRTLERAQAKLTQAESSRENLHGDPHWPYLNSNQRAFMADAAYNEVATAKSLFTLAQSEYDAALLQHARNEKHALDLANEQERQQKSDEEQLKHSAREEAAYKALYLPGYLAGGGTVKELETNWQEIWKREKDRRGDVGATIRQHLIAGGYNGL